MKFLCLFITRRLFTPLHPVFLTVGLLWLGTSLLTGCSTVNELVGNVKPVESKSTETQTTDLQTRHPQWKKMTVQADSPDAAWQSDTTAAVISINSACRENIDGNSDLKEVSEDLLSQWKNLKVSEEKNLTVSGHPALQTTGKGTYLKRNRNFQIVTIKSPHCIYDLIFLSPPETFEQDLSIFQEFRDKLILK